jgi:hypothetical protein
MFFPEDFDFMLKSYLTRSMKNNCTTAKNGKPSQKSIIKNRKVSNQVSFRLLPEK